MRKRYVAPVMACLSLAVPAGASAHARTATVALDYKLVLDRTDRTLTAVGVAILDGDRSVRVTTRSARVVVFGDLQEPMLRIDSSGAWANRASVTAVTQRLVTSGRGWTKVGGSSFAWHDHRLAPPPYVERAGIAARFRIPVLVGSRASAIAGSFVRYRRPLFWPWLAAAIAGPVLVAVAARLVPSARSRITVGLGGSAAVAAVTSLASFGLADSPSGRIAWVEIGLATFVAVAALAGLVRLRGERRTSLAAVIGAAAAATTLGSLGVFRHAVVVSALPALPARLVCALAFVAGAGAAVTGLAMDARTA